jgi:hypothetical protein
VDAIIVFKGIPQAMDGSIGGNNEQISPECELFPSSLCCSI